MKHDKTADMICCLRKEIMDLKFENIERDGEERKQKGGYGYRTEPKTCSARNTGRKTGREESIHTRHTLIETGKQTRNVHEGDRGYYR